MPSTEVSWLPRVATTPTYPQNLLRPSAKGCTDCSSQAYRIDDDSRRNLAGLANFAGLHGLGGRFSGLDMSSPGFRGFVYSLSALSAGASAYHGYRRSRGSLGWALGWGLLGGLFPIITPAIALAQGFGKPAGGRRRSTPDPSWDEVWSSQGGTRRSWDESRPRRRRRGR